MHLEINLGQVFGLSNTESHSEAVETKHLGAPL